VQLAVGTVFTAGRAATGLASAALKPGTRRTRSSGSCPRYRTRASALAVASTLAAASSRRLEHSAPRPDAPSAAVAATGVLGAAAIRNSTLHIGGSGDALLPAA